LTLSDALSIADLHRVIQLLMGWDGDHLHLFCIQGREYGIAYAGALNFDEDAAAVPLSLLQSQPTERFPLRVQLHRRLAKPRSELRR
jgi:hypothetical protein